MTAHTALIARARAALAPGADPMAAAAMLPEVVAALEAAQTLANVRVKPLVWYDRPDGQASRIGRCGDVAYGVECVGDGVWSFRRAGEKGRVIAVNGGPVFADEEDAMRGADLDHLRRIRAALEPAPGPDVAALVEALRRIAGGMGGWSASMLASATLATWEGRK